LVTRSARPWRLHTHDAEPNSCRRRKFPNCNTENSVLQGRNSLASLTLSPCPLLWHYLPGHGIPASEDCGPSTARAACRCSCSCWCSRASRRDVRECVNHCRRWGCTQGMVLETALNEGGCHHSARCRRQSRRCRRFWRTLPLAWIWCVAAGFARTRAKRWRRCDLWHKRARRRSTLVRVATGTRAPTMHFRHGRVDGSCNHSAERRSRTSLLCRRGRISVRHLPRDRVRSYRPSISHWHVARLIYVAARR